VSTYAPTTSSTPTSSFFQGDFPEGGFAEGEFDAVVAISAIEHTGLAAYGELPRERADHRMVAEFSRVLRGGDGCCSPFPTDGRDRRPGTACTIARP
jgi:hypothetical protein